MRATKPTVAGLVLTWPLFSQTQPSVAEILRKVADNYAQASEWDLAGTITPTMVQPPATIRTAMRFAGKGAKRHSDKIVDGSPEGSSIIIVDGANLWAYYPKLNQYTKQALSREPAALLEAFKAPLLFFQAGANAGKTAQLIRQESITIGNSSVDCFVIQFSVSGSSISGSSSLSAYHTWWIDAKRLVVVRDDQAAALDPSVGGSTTLWRTVKLNEPVADDLFTFTPPPGARLVERIGP